MEESTKLIETLLEKAGEYGKTSYELIKLKALDKTTDVVSSIISRTIVFVVIGFFILLLNLGVAFWLGEILGRTFYGFFVLAAFYGILALLSHAIILKWLKKLFGNYIVRRLLK